MRRKRLALIGCPTLACAPTACATLRSTRAVRQLPLVAEGHLVKYVYSNDSLFGIPVTIHRQRLLFVVDHAAEGSLISDSAIDRLHLPHMYASATRVDTLTRHKMDSIHVDSTAALVRLDGGLVMEYWGNLSIDLRFNRRPLSSDRVWIADEKFRDFPDVATRPWMLVGWQQFRDRVLYLSHSTGTVCVGSSRPRQHRTIPPPSSPYARGEPTVSLGSERSE